MTATILERLQADVHALLKLQPALAACYHLADDSGDLENRVLAGLKTMSTGIGGRRGLCVLVMAPELTATERNLPGPPMLGQIQIQTVEQVNVNREATAGTGIAAATAALHVLAALHHEDLGEVFLYADHNPVTTVEVVPGFVARAVTLQYRLGLDVAARVAPLAVSIAGSIATLTSATTGALIVYTLDGSFPSPLSAAALTYPPGGIETAAMAAGTVIRALAYDPLYALRPSPVLQFILTI